MATTSTPTLPTIGARAERLWQRAQTPWLVLAALCLLAFVTVMRAARGLFFFGDEWAFMLHRRGMSPQTFLEPHNEHPVAVGVFVYKALLAVFGMTSVVPFQAAIALFHIAAGVLLFLYARRRVGPRLALAPAALMLFLGAAWEDVMWPFQIAFIGAVVFGLVALLALDDRRDWLVSLALALSCMSSGLGLPFLGIALIQILWDERRWRRLWVFVLPVVLVAISRYGYGGAEQDAALTSPSDAVRWAVDMAAAGFGGFGALGINWGRPFMVVAVIAFVLGVRSGRIALRPALVALLAGTGAYWLLIAFGRAGLQQPADTSRYVYMSAALLLAILVTALGPTPVTRRGGLALTALTALACLSSVGLFTSGPADHRVNAAPLKMRLAALELLRDRVAPQTQVDVTSPDITAASYFSATDKFGSPAPSLDEVRAAPDGERQVFDATLVGLEQLALAPATGLRGGSCTTVAPGSEGTLRPGSRYRFSSKGAGELRLRRLATTALTDAEPWKVPAGAPQELTLPADSLRDPWHVAVGGAPVSVCRVA